VEHLITEQWPDLKERAEKETDHEKLTAILEEIEDLLSVLERRIAAADTLTGVGFIDELGGRDKSGQKAARRVPEIRSQ
jgi:hypothetical protein